MSDRSGSSSPGHARESPRRPGRITAGELARVCAQYELGEVQAVHKFHGGDRASPKVLLITSTGKYLLKRRAAGQDDPYSVAMAHHIVNALLEAGFPAPPLVGTKRDNNSMLQMDGAVYEVFRFVAGESYDRSREATRDAGRVLALFHAALVGLEAHPSPAAAENGSRPPGGSGGSYHAVADMPQRIEAVRQRLTAPSLRRPLRELDQLYGAARQRVDALGFGEWPASLIHGDWHPGNLMFRQGRVIAVLDFDSARRAPTIVDLANALLQFSIVRSQAEPSAWPAAPDLKRFASLLEGYMQLRSVSSRQRRAKRRDGHPPLPPPIPPEQWRAAPALMTEALIVEAITPIALTGRFGNVDPAAIVHMAAHKALWLEANEPALLNLVAPRG